ncbi:MAG: hypothetical protein HKN93_12050 [Acidimicrobiia bacterium]|nr:hypothetical protein [Acidimicrobiia bacterium]
MRALATRLYVWFQNETVEDIPEDLVDDIPEDVLQQLKDGVIDKIPDDVLDDLKTRFGESVTDRLPPDLVQFATDNPTLAAIFAVIGVLAILGFIWGVVKSAVKVAVFFGILAAIAWFLFAQQ